MNCVNHPELPAAAYCQNCGKPLCTGCLRSVGGVIYCEPCLGARLSPGGAGVNAPPIGMPANPMLAGLLGFIPGVGAMYNGQYVKALAHVLIFAVFVSLADKSFVFGLLVPAWIFYQVFDAGQTAKARRDGLPLPNPFGLNDLGTRLGMSPAPAAPPYVPPPPPAAAYDPARQESNPGFNPGPPASYTSSYVEPSPVYTPLGPAPLPAQPRTPVGAIVLIAIGVVLLLQTLGVFEQEWLSRAWPLIIIGVGAWLLYRRTHETPPGGGL